VSSISVTSNVATVTTSTDHGYNQYDIIAISGANEPVFNDSFRITEITSSTVFKVAVATADGSATGTITCKIAPLGWTREFTKTNKSVYRAPAGNRFYLRIDDSQAQYATMAMYETMSSVDTGTGKSANVYWKKSNASSTAAREWWAFGNDKFFYLFTSWDASGGNCGYAFGEFPSLRMGDLYNTLIIGYSSATPSYIYLSQSFTYCNNASAQNTGHYLIRSLLGSSTLGFFKTSTPSGQMSYGTSVSFPNFADIGLHLFDIKIIENAGPYRGKMPGLLVAMESTGGYFASGDRSVVIDDDSFVAIKIANNNGLGNCFILDGDWV